MKALFSKLILFLVVFSFLCLSITAWAQRRDRGPKSVRKAAGLVDEAEKLAEDKKYPEAIETYKIAIRLDPNYAPAFGGLGDAYFNSGNSEQALAAYKEQVRLAPNDADVQYDLGYFFNAMGRHGEAFAPLVKATALDPSFAEAFYGIGYAYSRGADFEKSIPFYRSAIKIKPDYGDAYYGLGAAYARLGKADLANEQLKKLSTVDAKLARKLEKEIPTALASADVTKASEPSQQVAQTSAPVSAQQTAPMTTPANTSQPPAQSTPPTSSAARKVNEIAATQKP